jgi:hypothetical protein
MGGRAGAWRSLAMLLLAILLVTSCQRGMATLPPEQRLSPPHGPPATPPQVVPYSGPVSLTVITAGMISNWARQYPGSSVTIRAIQGLVNRDAPRIFILQTGIDLHDRDWLNLLVSERKGALVSQPDAAKRIDDLTWYLQEFRSAFAGYILFDGRSEHSIHVAISLAGVINAVPIDQGAGGLLDAAHQAGLQQLIDVRNRDYDWLRSTVYWPQLNKNAIYFAQALAGDVEGADYAVAERMASFEDDPRKDSGMSTMATMIQDQHPGGIVFGYGYTDGTHGENLFVEQASRYDQSIMDTPPNLSVYMHFPAQTLLANSATPFLPTTTHRHYIAFIYSDGDNPRVIMTKLTNPGGDRWDSSLRGTIPIGWTIPPTMPGYAPIALGKLIGEATPNDEFIAGPSGFGYAYPSAIDEKNVFAAETQAEMAKVGLHSLMDLDVDGHTGFTNAAIDPLTAEPNVHEVFFTAFDGINQPSLGTIMWSNGKPVFPAYVMYRRPGSPMTPPPPRIRSSIWICGRSQCMTWPT